MTGWSLPLRFLHMLTAIRQSDESKIGAWEADKADGPFYCHCCHSLVTLRKGSVKAAHFAHQPPVTCEYGTGESEEHRRCKIEIYQTLRAHPQVTKCEMERNLITIRPDVSAYLNGVPIAIEVQLSNLSLEKIRYRTAEYARKGIYLLWLPLYSASLDRTLYDPRPWEHWLHTLYDNKVYYWLRGVKVLSVHFRDYYVNVRGRTRDYQKLSRMKVPINVEALSIIEDFQPVCRPEQRKGDQSTIPPARILTGLAG